MLEGYVRRHYDKNRPECCRRHYEEDIMTKTDRIPVLFSVFCKMNFTIISAVLTIDTFKVDGKGEFYSRLFQVFRYIVEHSLLLSFPFYCSHIRGIKESWHHLGGT